jgi:tRNA nucleotidyltransferase (CCA-adding enzyme)
MQEIAASGELLTISRERVWREFERALQSRSPGIFLRVLEECGALAALLDLDSKNTKRVADTAVILDDLAPHTDSVTRLAQAGLIFLAREADEKAIWSQFAAAFGLPKTLVQYAKIAIENPQLLSEPTNHEGKSLYQALVNAGAFRQGDAFNTLMELHDLWAKRVPYGNASYRDKWQELAELARNIDKSSVAPNLVGPDIGRAIQNARIKALSETS